MLRNGYSTLNKSILRRVGIHAPVPDTCTRSGVGTKHPRQVGIESIYIGRKFWISTTLRLPGSST